MAVFVLDKSGKPLMPCSEKRARLLLEHGRARIHRVLPFVIRLVDRKAGESQFQPLRIKCDPGSKITGIPNTHALDAVCVGQVDAVTDWRRPTLEIKCSGRGSYRRTRVTAQGFPRGYLMRQKQVHGFQTGDLVKAVVPGGKKVGTHVGRVAVRASGSFNIQTSQGVVQGVAHRHCRVLQRNDGYGYSIRGLQGE